MSVLEQVLETVLTLPHEEQEILINLLQKRYQESRRDEIAEDAQATLVAFHAGELRSQSVEEVIATLRRSVEEECN